MDAAASIQKLIDLALAEDLGSGDVTSLALIPPDARAVGAFIAKAEGIVSGLRVARAVFERLEPSAAFEQGLEDGSSVSPGKELARVAARARTILAGERTALNFVCRLSGIATLTRAFVRAVEGTQARIYDTRKTAPGWRELDKLAVRAGGGSNHRMGLYDAVLIKDNHLALLKGDIEGAVRKARLEKGAVEIEVTNVELALRAARAGADILLLDNMTPSEVEACAREVRKEFPSRPQIEVSGGVNADNVRAYALAGAQRISVGALTHSSRSLDISLEILPQPACQS